MTQPSTPPFPTQTPHIDVPLTSSTSATPVNNININPQFTSLIYDGPLLQVPAGEMYTKYVEYFVDPLKVVGKTPAQVFEGWRAVIRHRTGNTDCNFYPPASKERMQSKAAVLRFMGLGHDTEPMIQLALLARDFIPVIRQQSTNKKLKSDENSTTTPIEEEDPYDVGWGLNGEYPSRRRRKTIETATNEAAKLIVKIARADTNGCYLGLELNGKIDRPMSLNHCKVKLETGQYHSKGLDAVFLCDDFERDLLLMFEQDPIDDEFKPEAAVKMIKEGCHDFFAKFKSELDAARKEEAMEWAGRNKSEPVMPQWHKELMSECKYEILNCYVPAEGLLPEEVEALLDKLKVKDDTADKSNRWVYSEGLRNLEAWAEVVKYDTTIGETTWGSLNQVGPHKDIEEQHTWGIDCFTRCNIELAISTVQDDSIRLSPLQTRYYIERLLLREINHVRPIENGYDIRIALNNLLDKVSMGQYVLDKEDSSAAGAVAEVEEELVGRRIKVFWPKDKSWYIGTISKLTRKKNEVVVSYDDGEEMTENLSRVRYNLVSGGAASKTHDPYMTQAQLVTTTETVLKAIEHYGNEIFAVHSKGLGVITQVELHAGQMLGKYWGHLYPAWLWEQKEQAEDDMRRNEKKKGRMALPDFWNIRLEIPPHANGGDSDGFDLMHVDAKYAGNFTSRMSHSCRPNCGAMTALIDGKYCVALRALRDIQIGEELTIDYNCVTDSMDEFRAAICLCGAHDCRGSFLYITGATNQNLVSDRYQTNLHRVALLLRASFACGEIERALGSGFTPSWPKWVPNSVLVAAAAAITPTVQKKKKGKSKSSGGYKVAVASSTTTATAVTTLEIGTKIQKDGRVGTVAGKVGNGGYQLVKWDDGETSKCRRGEMSLYNLDDEEEDIVDPQEEQAMKIVNDFLLAHGLGGRALHLLPSWALKFAAYAIEYIDDEEWDLPRTQLYHMIHYPPKGVPALRDSKGQEERWNICLIDSKGLANQRVTNLIIALDKARHHMCTRLTTNNPAPAPAFKASRKTIHPAPTTTPMLQTISNGHLPATTSTTATTITTATQTTQNVIRLRERWWIGDRCLAKWVGDDAADYPDWYPATVTHVYVSTSELRVVYDVDGAVNRIPTHMAKRPSVNESFPKPLTALNVQNHQAPFRPLEEYEVAWTLWNDKDSGVAVRLLRSIKSAYLRLFSVWQMTLDRKTHKPYWWNFVSREVSMERPKEVLFEQKTTFSPSALDSLDKLLNNRSPSTREEAQKALRDLRDLVLTLPVVSKSMEEQHQKAADLLTMLSFTNNFFVLSEPEASKQAQSGSGAGGVNTRQQRNRVIEEDNGQHHVISALTSWIGQGTARCPEIAEMVGSALLPPIESAYEECDLGYSIGARGILLRHMTNAITRMSEWPAQVVDSFPGASLPPPAPPEFATQWPHPCPPIRLCGSPALDAAMLETIDYERIVALSKEKKSSNYREPAAEARERGTDLLRKVSEALRKAKRDVHLIDPRDISKTQPPPMPELFEITWVQCEACNKWRCLPTGMPADKFPHFHCSLLVRIDSDRANCAAKEQREEEVILQRYTPNLDYIVTGSHVDTYSPGDLCWIVSEVIDVTADALQTKPLGSHYISKTEWHSKKPGEGESMTVLPVHTMTERTDFNSKPLSLAQSKIPYKNLVPEGVDVPEDVARCLRNMVDRIYNQLKPKKPVPPSMEKGKSSLLRAGLSAANIMSTYGVTELTAVVRNYSPAQRAAFLNFIDAERRFSPMTPFVAMVARWGVMDDFQRQTWERKKLDTLGHGNEAILPSVFQPKPDGVLPLGFTLAPDARIVTLENRACAVQINPKANLPVNTVFGVGMIVSISSEQVMQIKLAWGIVYMPVSASDVFCRMVQVAPNFAENKAKKVGVTRNPGKGQSSSVLNQAAPITTSERVAKKGKFASALTQEELNIDVDVAPVRFDFSAPGFSNWMMARKRQWMRRWWAFRGSRNYESVDLE